jgi:hypothetical protein
MLLKYDIDMIYSLLYWYAKALKPFIQFSLKQEERLRLYCDVFHKVTRLYR